MTKSGVTRNGGRSTHKYMQNATIKSPIPIYMTEGIYSTAINSKVKQERSNWRDQDVLLHGVIYVLTVQGAKISTLDMVRIISIMATA